MEIASAAAAAEQDQEELGFAECECCGLSEECTAIYVETVRGRYGGRWICGLCAEAVADETFRSDRLISTEEALQRQASFYLSFRSQVDAADHLISFVRLLIRRSKEPAAGSGFGSHLDGVGDGDLLVVKP